MTPPPPAHPVDPPPAPRRWAVPLRAVRVVFALALVAGAVIALQPNPQGAPSSGWDKLDHAAGFALLMLVALPARLGPAAIVAVALVGYGGAIELLQRLVPGRSAEWGDLLADAAGVALGWALAWGVRAAVRARAARRSRPR